MNSEMNFEVLNHGLIPLEENHAGDKWLFQQDGASVKRTKFKEDRFESNDV